MAFLKSLGILLLFIIAATPASAKYVQVVYVMPSNTDVKLDGEYFVYENDSVKLVYNFWSENGMMAFMFYNKTDIQLFRL